MNANDLLDLSLNQVEPPRLADLDRQLADDPGAARVLDLLSRNLERLLDDGLGELEPPAGLARRTTARVTQQAPRRSLLEFAPVRVPFRWADVAVAAGILVAGLLTLIPAVQRARFRADLAGCTFNLRGLGTALSHYSGQHGSYPYIPPGSPGSRAGAFVFLLNDAGLLPDTTPLDCPGDGKSLLKPPLPGLKDACHQEEGDHKCPPCLRQIDYAYTLGYRHPTGRPGPISSRLQAAIPLLSDTPGHDENRILEGNSRNHGGHGQNVLFTDGHVSWHPSRRLSPTDSDMFLNQHLRVAPGVHADDAVLAPGPCPFAGEK